MEREPQSGELVPTRVCCSACRADRTIALKAERPIRDELAATTCPACRRHGTLKLAPPLPVPPAKVIGMYEEPPDDLGDEELLERRARARRPS